MEASDGLGQKAIGHAQALVDAGQNLVEELAQVPLTATEEVLDLLIEANDLVGQGFKAIRSKLVGGDAGATTGS